MANKIQQKKIYFLPLFFLMLILGNAPILAQSTFPIQLSYGGVELNGSVDISTKIQEKIKGKNNPEIYFSDQAINADVSKYSKPIFVH